MKWEALNLLLTPNLCSCKPFSVLCIYIKLEIIYIYQLKNKCFFNVTLDSFMYKTFTLPPLFIQMRNTAGYIMQYSKNIVTQSVIKQWVFSSQILWHYVWRAGLSTSAAKLFGISKNGVHCIRHVTILTGGMDGKVLFLNHQSLLLILICGAFLKDACVYFHY